MKNRGWFHNWIFHSWPVSAEGLGLLRIVLSLFILFFLIPGQGTDHFAYLSTMPSDFYTPPPGPLMLLEGFPHIVVFLTVHTILLISLFAMLLGYGTKTASITAGISILFLQGFIFSIGKVNHEILVALVPLVMAFSNWGAAFSLDAILRKKKVTTEGWPIALLALFIGFMMFTAGFPKILGGWLDPSTQATQGHLFNQFFVRERQALLAEWFVSFDNDLFWELLDWATILFETGFLFAIWKVSWFRFFVGVAILFHLSAMLTLNIAFLPNFLAYAVFLNWTGIYQTSLDFYQKITKKKGVRSKLRSVLIFALITTTFFAILNRFSSTDVVLTNYDLTLQEVVIVFAASAIVIGFTFKKITGLKRGTDE